jgi:hypothetical protein
MEPGPSAALLSTMVALLRSLKEEFPKSQSTNVGGFPPVGSSKE